MTDKGNAMDLTALTNDQLDALSGDIFKEQDRRAKLAQLPDQLAAMARDAIAAGCDPAELRGRVDEALTPE